MTKQNHSWGPPNRIPNALALPRKTERQCVKCDVVKVTWHLLEGSQERFRTEFWRGMERIECAATPACETIFKEAEAA